MNVETRTIVRSALDATEYTRGAQQVAQANERMAASGTAAAGATERQQTQLRESSGAIDRLQRSLDSAYRAQQQFEAAQRRINAAVEAGHRSAAEGARLVDLARQRYLGAGTAAQALAVANDNAGRGIGRFGQAMGQAGFQIQDFAVQVAAGQSALVALGQQGSQLLGIFGTGGAIAGAALAIGVIAVQLFRGRDAAEALNKAIDAQADFYKQANEAAELYRSGLDREAEAILRLGNLYASYSAERRRAEELRLGDQQAELARQQAALGTRAQGMLPDGIQNMIDLAASRSARGQGIGAGAAEISPQLREALTAIMEFRAVSDQVSSESISRLSTRLQEAAASASGDLAPSLLRAATHLRSMLPDSDRLEASLRQNATQMDALRAGTDGAGTALGGAASAARQLAEHLRRVQEIAAANPALSVQQEAEGLRRRLDALRSGGTAGDDAEQRRLENERRVAEAINKAYEDQLKRLLDLGQARAQAEEGARSAAATVGQEVMRRNELADSLDRERKARERADREAEQAGRRAERREETEARRAEREREREARRFQETQEREELQRLNRIEEANRRTTDSIVSYGADAFADMFEQNGRGWQGMLDTFASTFRRLIMRLAAEAILRPIIAPIVSGLGLGGSGGLSLANLGITGDGAVAPVGGLGNILGIGSALNGLSGGGLSSALGLGAGATGGLTGLGVASGLFGNGVPIVTGPGGLLVGGGATSSGVVSQAGLFGTTTLGGALAGLGGGFMIGSTLGGMLAQSPAQATNANIGAGAGAGIGFLVGGPLGALVGGGIGGIGGSFFGPSNATPFWGARVEGVDGALAITDSGGKRDNGQLNALLAATQQQMAQVNAALAAAGISVSGARMVGSDPADPTRPGTLNDAAKFFSFSAKDSTLNRVLAGRTFETFDQLGGAATWVLNTYNAMTASTSAAEQFARQIQAVNDNFEAAIKQARDYGLETDKIAQAQRRATETLAAQRQAGILSAALGQSRILGDFLAGMARGSGSPQSQFGAAQEQFAAAVEAARRGGRAADLSRVTGAAQALREANAAFNGSGAAAATVEGMVRSTLAGLGVSLDLPGFAPDLDASINRWGEAQVDELQQLRDGVGAMREELRTLNLTIRQVLAA